MGCGSSVERVRVAVDADGAWTPRRVNFDFGREAKKVYTVGLDLIVEEKDA